MNAATWNVEQHKILSRAECDAVIGNLEQRGGRSVNARMNLAVFRLATCVGLRVSEIGSLQLRDVLVAGTNKRPLLTVRATNAKSGRERKIPLHWDRGTLENLRAWKAERTAQGAKPLDFFVCSQSQNTFGARLHRVNLRRRFITVCKSALGAERAEALTIHDGRHTYVSRSLAGGRSLAEVRDAAGHANISTTSIYTHIAVDDDGTIGDLFGDKVPAGVDATVLAAAVEHVLKKLRSDENAVL